MKYCLLLLLGCFHLHLAAQEMSWKDHEKLADEKMAIGQYDQAADNYEMAWNGKPGKKELLAKAAEAYRLHRNYRKAGELYKNLIIESDFPLARLYYGRALKQNGQYQLARTVLEKFLDTYQGEDQAAISTIVKQDIRGCGLAQQWSKRAAGKNTLQHLQEINSGQQEFAPLPFSDDILYFSTNQEGKVKILRTQRKEGKFSRAIEPNLPRTPGGHFCHGTFTPDNERFYFTVCQGDENWKGIQSKCDLYVTMRENNRWSSPQKMRDYVKMDGTTVTHPFVYHDGDTEILYFSSDRSGGKGGMDIWYITRQIAGKDIDFTYPVNAGPKINTAGDEVTPFYQQTEQKFYFSSNGHINIGGFDIFMAEGGHANWSSPKNLELPYNSSADDYYFVQSPSGQGAYFVSNRIYGPGKTDTMDDDIFYLGQSTSALTATVSGQVRDEQSKAPLSNVEVSIYEKVDTGLKRLLKAAQFADGNYEFPILADREFLIEAHKDGYAEASFEFDTYNTAGKNPGQDLYLGKGMMTVNRIPKSSPPAIASTTAKPETTTTPPPSSTSTSTATNTSDTPPSSNSSSNTTSSVVSNSRPIPPSELFGDRGASPSSSSSVPAKSTQTRTTNKREAITTAKSPASGTYTNSRFKKDGVTTTAPRHQGEYFKVQLAVVIDYDLESGTFLGIQDLGRLDTEYIIEKGWTRVLVADYFTIQEARAIMDKARLRGYPEAFIVRYLDGYRKN